MPLSPPWGQQPVAPSLVPRPQNQRTLDQEVFPDGLCHEHACNTEKVLTLAHSSPRAWG